jgi:uncharacterized membrane protein
MKLVKLIVGILGLVIVYSYRPPSGLGDALMMMGEGRNFYLKEPVYFFLMAVFAIVAILGVVDLVRANGQKPVGQDENSAR